MEQREEARRRHAARHHKPAPRTAAAAAAAAAAARRRRRCAPRALGGLALALAAFAALLAALLPPHLGAAAAPPPLAAPSWLWWAGPAAAPEPVPTAPSAVRWLRASLWGLRRSAPSPELARSPPPWQQWHGAPADAIMAARRATASPARLAQVLSMRPAARAEVASEPLLDQETRVVRAQMEYTGV